MKLNVRAILTGFVVDFVGSVFAMQFGVAVLSVIYGIALSMRGSSSSPEFQMQELAKTPIYDGVTLAAGLLMTFIGGWVAAGISEDNKVLNAALGGVLVLLATLPFAFFVPSSDPLWYQVFGYGIEVPLAAFGGWARQRDELQRSTAVERKDGDPPISRPF